LRNNRNYADIFSNATDSNVHIDIDYDSEKPLDLSKRAFAKYKDDYYTRYAASQNTIGRFRKEHFAQYDYSKDLESPFARSNRAYQRENTLSQRYADEDEQNLYEIHIVDDQPRQIKILSKTDEIFDHETSKSFTEYMKLIITELGN